MIVIDDRFSTPPLFLNVNLTYLINHVEASIAERKSDSLHLLREHVKRISETASTKAVSGHLSWLAYYIRETLVDNSLEVHDLIVRIRRATKSVS